MLACPAAACEALLGWWNPTSEENQAKIREAQELEGYQSDANQDMEDADGEGFEVCRSTQKTTRNHLLPP